MKARLSVSEGKRTNWKDIRYAWDNGNSTLQEKALEYDITVAEILLYAKKNDWGPRNSAFTGVDTDQEPNDLIRELTINNLSAISHLLNGTVSPKGHLEIQKTIQAAKETLGVLNSDDPKEKEMTKEQLIELAKERGLPVSIFL